MGYRWIYLAVVAAATAASQASAQQVNVQTPFNGVGHSYYEHIGVRWGIQGNGWFFNFGGPGPVPQFGGFDPGAQANFGFGGPNGFLNITAGQGSDRSIVSSSPSVTVMNGGTGFFSDTIQRPFVTGLIPVVGSAPGLPPSVVGSVLGPSILEERLSRLEQEGSAPPSASSAPAASAPATSAPVPAASSAERGAASVADIKARREAEKSAKASAAQAEIEALVEKARGAAAEGKAGVARIFLQQALRRTEGEQRGEIQTMLDRLDSAK